MTEKSRQKRKDAQSNFKPNPIRYLLIAEAPPDAEERYFYFTDVTERDGLYVEVMRAVFPQENGVLLDIDTLRNKARFLEAFSKAGFFLIDALDDPLPQDMKFKDRCDEVRNALPDLIKKLRCLKMKDAKVIIIKATVHHAVYDALTQEGLDIVNDKPIDFPGAFTTGKFRDKMAMALASYYRDSSITIAPDQKD